MSKYLATFIVGVYFLMTATAAQSGQAAVQLPEGDGKALVQGHVHSVSRTEPDYAKLWLQSRRMAGIDQLDDQFIRHARPGHDHAVSGEAFPGE
jgi:hypothetical protein